jgi:hypothetical protein
MYSVSKIPARQANTVKGRRKNSYSKKKQKTAS